MAGAAPVVFPALWTAARDGRAEEVRRLLAEEVDIEARGGQDQTSPLHEAARQGREEVVRVLLAHGADTSAKNVVGSTPLRDVAYAGSRGDSAAAA